MKVQVYRNLHRSGKDGAVYSVRSKATRRVIDHRQWIILTDVKCHVGQSGRERVLREKSKNVHAWIEGLLEGTEPVERSQIEFLEWMDIKAWKHRLVGVTYNPYKYTTFVNVEDESPLHKVDLVVITPLGVKMMVPL